MNQHPRKRDIIAIKKSFKINNLNVCKDKGGHKNNEIWTEGNETRTDVYKILETSEMNKELLD